MRHIISLLVGGFVAVVVLNAQSDRDFSGSWKLNPSRSEMKGAVPAETSFRAEQTPATLTVFIISGDDSATVKLLYPLDGRSEKHKLGDLQRNTQTKWEGSALLANTIVSGPQNYTLMERWRRSNDGRSLTIRRTIVRGSGETESTLVYENAAAPAPESKKTDSLSTPQLITRAAPPSAGSAETPHTNEYLVTAGTRILLRLTNAVDTKHTAPGDRLYLETAAPVFVEGKLVIPVGSFVYGLVTESKQAGHVKGTSALDLEFTSLTLPNGTARDLRSRPASMDERGNLDRTEGKIKGESSKGEDAGKVAKTTAAGTTIGAVAGGMAGHLGMGAGIGAAAGAAGGLASVLRSRGKDVVLAKGTTMEMVLNQDLRYKLDELR